jgi:uncharacterized protein (TIGR02145 family)
VTLTAQSERYCDLAITKDVVVQECTPLGATGITFAEFIPCAGAPYGSTYTLTDDRDGKQYKIKYLADGRYWMAQNLAFGNCTVNSYKEDNSAAAAAATPTVAEGYAGHCRSHNNTTYGFYYSWPAAMNNVNAIRGLSATYTTCSGTDASANACKGICPTGWHLPTYEEFARTEQVFESQYLCTKSCWFTEDGLEWVASNYYANNDYYRALGEVQHWTSSSLDDRWPYHAVLRMSSGLAWYTNSGTSVMNTVSCVMNY